MSEGIKGMLKKRVRVHLVEGPPGVAGVDDLVGVLEEFDDPWLLIRGDDGVERLASAGTVKFIELKLL